MWFQFDWCEGPLVKGARTWLFCAWLGLQPLSRRARHERQDDADALFLHRQVPAPPAQRRVRRQGALGSANKAQGARRKATSFPAGKTFEGWDQMVSGVEPPKSGLTVGDGRGFDDALLGLPGVRVLAVTKGGAGLLGSIETIRRVMGCPSCGLITRIGAASRRSQRRMHSIGDTCVNAGVGPLPLLRTAERTYAHHLFTPRIGRDPGHAGPRHLH
jgi:hypothetical protein